MLTDYVHPGSLRNRLRNARFARFLQFINSLPTPVKILDVGGTVAFWETMDIESRDGMFVTLLNLEAEPSNHPRLQSLAGDARDLSRFADGEFDVVFSNSVIEHVGSESDQLRMAREVRRVGRNYFIQTPNRFFPIEPHFQFPLFQFLPESLQVWLLRNFKLATYRRAHDRAEALEWIHEIQLLSQRQVQQMFPEAEIVREDFCGLTKSFMAIHLAA